MIKMNVTEPIENATLYRTDKIVSKKLNFGRLSDELNGSNFRVIFSLANENG